jgi:hypothetical protein
MTDGRFETTLDLRPNGWDTRHHWTKAHAPFRGDAEHVRDHMERESCPFHDLRADGCFQPEYAGLGVEGDTIAPGKLVKRPDGNRFAHGGSLVQPRSRGVGGLPIPHDVEPAPQQKLSPTSHLPWKTGTKRNGPFGAYEYMTVANEAGPRPEPMKFFNTGKAAGLIGSPTKHYPEPFPESSNGRKPFRLAAGVARRKDIVGPAPPCPPMDVKPPKRSSTAPRPPYHANKPLQGTFSAHPGYIPDPWAPAAIKWERRPLFTYAAKSKRSMPIQVPWRAGTDAAEAVRPPVDTVNSLMHSTTAVTARGRPLDGERTLLRSSVPMRV